MSLAPYVLFFASWHQLACDGWQQHGTRLVRRRRLVMADSTSYNFPEENQVRMFGARLDASMAGRRACSRSEILAVLADEEGVEVSTEQRAEIFYAEAVERMNRADYKRSVELLNRACYFASPTSRRGGQMQLWLAQALYAAGQREQCVRLLTVLKKHPDRDVRVVAKELVFIIQAPELVLNSSNYITINMDNFKDDSVYQRAPDGTITKRAQVSKLPEEPEYGSVEWALAQAELADGKQSFQFDPLLGLAATILCVASLAFFREPPPTL